VHGINVRLKPGADEFQVAAALNAALPRGRRALTWFESEADFQSIIRFEKYMVFFLLTFIVVVAALSIMSSLLIAVVRKTREIGLLGALGAAPGKWRCVFVRRVFCSGWWAQRRDCCSLGAC
jgi:lipoprotein-releasing system permease protein